MSSYDTWKATNPALEGDGCPECGEPTDGDRYGASCSECEWSVESLPSWVDDR